MPETGDLFADFLEALQWKHPLPEAVSIINPYEDPEVRRVLRQFCKKYYGNQRERILILGINPGRFGAGITGIPFTDPIALENNCGISNPMAKKHELSSRFIYEMIYSLGTPEYFYDHFILSAVCPLGFLKGIKNHNYYDQPELLEASGNFIKKSLLEHSRWNVSRKVVFALGKKNSLFLDRYNRELKLFDEIQTLDHPRYIMQYRLRKKHIYLDNYEKRLSAVIPILKSS